MTIGAFNPDVVGFRLGKISGCFFVTHPTKSCRDVAFRHNVQWLMRGVTTQTLCGRLSLDVGWVTLETSGDIFVLEVAASAE